MNGEHSKDHCFVADDLKYTKKYYYYYYYKRIIIIVI